MWCLQLCSFVSRFIWLFEVFWGSILLDCTSQTWKPCTCLALGQEKEPGVSNRDISGLMGRGIYTAKARSWSNILLCAAPGGQDMGVVFTPKWKEMTSSREPDVRWAHQSPGKQRGTPPPPAPLLRIITGWRAGNKRVERPVMWARYRWSSTGWAGDVQRARQQPSWVPWPCNFLHL